MHESSMRAVACLLVFAVLIAPITSAGESGVNEDTTVEGTEIQEIIYPNEVSSGTDFELALALTEEASGNGTNVSWITQICINSGVCYAPESHSMLRNSDGGWEASIVPDDTVTYVNWRIELNWADGNKTSVPDTGFGWKVWSDCWYDSGEWGGSDQNCIDESSSEEDSGILPGFGVMASLLAILMAGLVGRRE